jgi:hypothetical protein
VLYPTIKSKKRSNHKINTELIKNEKGKHADCYKQKQRNPTCNPQRGWVWLIYYVEIKPSGYSVTRKIPSPK